MSTTKLAGGVALGALLAALAAAPAFSAEVTKQRLENADAEPQNWITTFQNYSSHRYSRLNQINRTNAANLKVAYTMSIASALAGAPAGAELEGAPLVDDGIMFLNDGWGMIYKVDVRDGKSAKILWTADPAIDKAAETPRTRGLALWGNLVLENIKDGRVVAAKADTGEIVWDKQIARTEANWEFDAGEGFTAAPLAVEGKLLVGQSLGDRGTRGWLAAINIADGKEVWRTYTVPGPGQPGHETWKDDHNAWRTGGGSLWTTGSYDPAQKITIWGTANPVPMFDPEFRPGDNLYTNSAIAFDVDTGKIKWYFQYTANESWDYDENGVHLLYDATIDGQARKVVGHFSRGGYYYQLDRTNGSFINYGQYTKEVNWTKGLDPKTGKPLEYDPKKLVQTYIPATRNSRSNPTVNVCPGPAGGLRWQPVAYNPDKKIAYGAGADYCGGIKVVVLAPVSPQGGNPIGIGKGWLGGEGDFNVTTGSITAIDVTTGKQKAKRMLTYQNMSGVLATAGGIVVTGELDGTITVYNDETLDPLWTLNAGISGKAPAMSFSVNGKQYIAIIMGGNPAPDAVPALKSLPKGAMMYVLTL